VGAWLCDLGLDARGGAYVSETPDENFEKMHALHARAVVDLQRALQMRPRSVAVARVLVVLGTRSSRIVDTHEVLQAALKSCSTCLHIRVAYMIELEPRWGGSHEQMDAFAAETMKTSGAINKKLAVLGGYSSFDRADDTEDLNEKRRLLDEAIRHGDASDFYRDRAGVRVKQHDEGGALADLRKVVELRPAVGLNHAALAVRLAQQKDWRDAEKEMRLAMALDSHGPVRGFHRSLVSIVRGQVGDPLAPRELIDLALAFETDAQRIEELRKRRDGRTSLVVAVDEPAAWAEQPPAPSALALLLDGDDAMQRSAAWCRLLERAIRESRPQSTIRFRDTRCEVESVERALASDGSTLRLVIPRDPQKNPFRPFFIVAADGSLLGNPQWQMRALAPDSAVVVLRESPDGVARKAIVSTSASAAGKLKRTATLQVQVIDSIAVPPLRVALGGPQAAVEPSKKTEASSAAQRATAIALAPLQWRLRETAKARHGNSIELVTRADRPKVVATFVWDDKKGEWRGPNGTKSQGFRRIPDEHEKGAAVLDAWNREHDPCATTKPTAHECVQSAAP
jgi:hypothetical protein